LILIAALYYLGSAIVTVALNLDFPYQLDWIEGPVYASVLRIAAGLPVYAPPNLDYVATLYPPVFFHLSAGVQALTGGSFLPMRIVSLASTLGIVALLVAFGRRYRAPWWASLAVVTSFVAFCGICRNWFVVGRVDLPALLFVLSAGVLLLEFRTLRWTAFAAGLLAALGVLTKQSSLPIVAVAAAWSLVRMPRERTLLFVGGGLAGTVGILALTGDLANPWFYRFTLSVPASHPVRPEALFLLVPAFLAIHGSGFVIPALFGSAALSDRGSRWRAFLADPWNLLCLTAVAVGVVSNAKMGGSRNCLLAPAVFCSFQAMRLAGRFCVRSSGRAWILAAAQVLIVAHPTWALWVTPADVEAGNRLVRTIASQPGNVFFPAFPAYSRMAGKKPWADFISICDYGFLDPGILDEMKAGIRAHRFSAVIPNNDVAREAAGLCDVPDLDRSYRPLQGSLVDVPDSTLFGDVHNQRLGSIYLPDTGPPPATVEARTSVSAIRGRSGHDL
jgi:hypothetical protein